MTGEFTPLIFLSLFHAQAPRILIRLCFSFSRARDAQDTTKQTGAFSLPLFLYISGREAWQSHLQIGFSAAISDKAIAIVNHILHIEGWGPMSGHAYSLGPGVVHGSAVE